MLQTNDTIKVKILDKDLLLFRRSAKDVYKAMEFAKINSNDGLSSISYLSAMMLNDSLKKNIPVKSFKWYEFKKKREFNKKVKSFEKLISIDNLFDSLSNKELFELSDKLLELEGLKADKKKVPEQENSQADLL